MIINVTELVPKTIVLVQNIVTVLSKKIIVIRGCIGIPKYDFVVFAHWSINKRYVGLII